MARTSAPLKMAASAFARAAAFCLFPVAIVAPAMAETVDGAVAIGFAPPLGTPHLYRIEQTRMIGGREHRFVSERLLRFGKDGSGYRLAVTLQHVESDAPPALAEPFHAALLPLIGLSLQFHLDMNGVVTRIDDADAVAAGMLDALRRMQLAFAKGSPRHRAATNILALLAEMSAEGRLALLSGEVRPLFLFANGFVLPGQGRGLKSMAGSPLGRPETVEGRVRLTGRQAGTLSITEQLAGNGTEVGIDYQVDRTSGLVVKQERVLKWRDQVLTEQRTFQATRR